MTKKKVKNPNRGGPKADLRELEAQSCVEGGGLNRPVRTRTWREKKKTIDFESDEGLR